jgi:hypothetical protein
MRFILAALAIAVPMLAQDGIKPPVQTSSTEKVAFAPGGTIHVNGSYGYLTVEGWDQPEVVIIVTKSLGFGKSGTKEEDARRLESIRIVTAKNSPTDLTISTMLASRHGDWAPPLPANTTNGVRAEYEIHVPRQTRLVIQHGVGYVQVGGVTADIEASVRRGDILLMLPDSGTYSVDARTRLGKVSSDFEGTSVSQFVVGQRFTRSNSGPARRLHLRTGFGGITIKGVPAEAETPVPAGTR